MAAHRYWQLYISKNGGGDSISIGELILAETPGGPQGAVGGTASASSVAGANAASRAFDGVASSANYWQSASATREYLQYDMGPGGSLDVVEMRLYFNGASVGATTYPSNYVLLSSDDSLQWAIQRAWSGHVYSNGETKALDATPLPSNQVFNREVIHRDVRYNAAANFGPAPSVARIPPYGPSAAALMTPWSGNYFLAGSTTALGSPVARRVNLVEEKAGQLVRTTFTGADGQFRFDQVGPGPWTLIGVDVSAEQNSVIYAHIPPVPMT